jgi:xylulose-5-phosphate/fructose-6-phosphate phosphoketolase
MDTVDRLPQTGDKGICLKQQLNDKLIEHKQYINKHGEDLPKIRNWKWSTPNECTKAYRYREDPGGRRQGPAGDG